MKYAWIENGRIRDLAENPTEQFHPDIASNYDTEVPDDVQNGWEWDGSVATEPAPPEVSVTPNPVIRITAPVSVAAGVAFDAIVNIIDLNDDSIFTELSGTYYVPLKNSLTGDLDQIITLNIVEGEGTTAITIASIGVYDIAEELIRPKPTVRFEANVDIVVI